MKKRILFTLAGILTIFSTIALFYLFLTSLNDGGNIFYLLGSLVSIITMVFNFLKATKPEAPKHYVVPTAHEGQDMLSANNAMIKEYNQTEKAKERLRMLELAGSAGNE